MPERSTGDFRIELEFPSGTPLEETMASVARFAEWIDADDDVKSVFSQVGRTEKTLESLNEYTAPNTANIRVILNSGRGGRQKGDRIQREASKRLDEMPGTLYSFRDEGIGLGEILATDEAAFSMGIVAEDPLTAVQVAEELMTRLADKSTLRDIQIDRVIGTPNLVVHLDSEEILRSGLDPDAVARELRNRIRGVEATTFNEVDQRIDISVRIPRNQRRDLSTALDSPVELTEGATVPLRSFLDIREEAPVRELTRRNQRRMVTISADLRRGSLDDAWREAMAVAETLNLPAGVSFVQSGERAEMTRSFTDLGWAMLLAVMLVYMILAAQFESFIDPLLIAAVIPIGLGGSFLAIAFSGGSINILSLIGMVALIGIAVNDAIIKVDTMRRLRAEGVDGYTAILEASRLRLRPILMTSASTIFAMVPLAIGLGSGEQLQRPLALTIIGGLFVTTTLTLLYTPILYQLAHRIRRPEA
jgi:HAE1 family hydrophobic/amphiphilic exporter-1